MNPRNLTGLAQRPIDSCFAQFRSGLILLLFSLAGAGGCSGPARPDFTDAQFKARIAAENDSALSSLQEAAASVVARLSRKVDHSDPSAPPTMHFLAMSGGGDYGAFGAGFLVGWGSAPTPETRRPDFDCVTGVSTGALLAPFAFVGTDESCRVVEGFYRNPKPDWVESRGMLFFAPWNPSFMVIPKLAKAIEFAVDQQMIEQMAAEARKDKLLVISATNLDLGRQHLWNLGAESEAAVASGNNERVHKMLLASAAIPAVKPRRARPAPPARRRRRSLLVRMAD